MFSFRIQFCVVFVGLLLLSLAGCGGRHDSDEKFVLVSTNIKVPYWQLAGSGFMQAAREMKIRASFVGPDTYDPRAQQEEFRKAVASKPSGILVAPANAELLKGDIDAAISAGIPVITIDSDAPSSRRLLFIGTNNYQAGVMGAKVMISQLKGKGNVVVFTMPGQANLDDRLRGYRDTFASQQIKIDRVVDIKGDPVIAFDTTKSIVEKEANKINGFICLEAVAGKEVANVLDRYKVKDKPIVAMDTDSDTLTWVKKGVIAATIAQKPYTMSYVGMKVLDDLYHDKFRPQEKNWAQDPFAPIPAFVDTGLTLVDNSNVADFEAMEKSAR
ncbi:MAG: substrate-binding domain-containing protein, partial [Acidobacteriaceae bacterium]|nr:substrate-binding domain-containing protein [Acidobacteriaceae bacterium]